MKGQDNDNKENRNGKLEFSRKINMLKSKKCQSTEKQTDLFTLKYKSISYSQLLLFSNRFCVITE